ncbi:uncharacterized protein LOC117113353 [Anneissia japonica]|uniref:uncharacterized protein LOC117113353 n=1 Tax=Anneissia japonica TaxID=1529436 RepID=UPI00142596D1|nr:uncharacterized protein LOC117113353 [Anneissia japonica]
MGVSTNQLKEMRKKVIDKLANKSSEPSDVTCIWDYAGQLEYFITHRIFITDGNSYGVVFSLVDALDKLAKRRDPKKGHFEMTNLQMIIFWIRLIYEYAVLLRDSEEKPLINGIIASPTISLIGTHKDLLTGSDAEKQAKIDVVLGKILEELKGKPYERHVDREMYAVDNTTALDEGIERLKIKVGGFMKSMARTVPINWMDFQIEVQEAGKTTLRMSLDKIAKIADQCGINEDNVIHVLNYLNDLGIILYSPTNKKLKNTVIINIHMLIGIFMKIITVVEPDDVKTAPVMIQYWRKFDETSTFLSLEHFSRVDIFAFAILIIIAKIADQCGINEDNVIHVLNYLNDLGIILYSPTNKKLKNTVIINIHMLIGIFMKIITVVEPDDVKIQSVSSCTHMCL